jgi:hypothetical protein
MCGKQVPIQDVGVHLVVHAQSVQCCTLTCCKKCHLTQRDRGSEQISSEAQTETNYRSNTQALITTQVLAPGLTADVMPCSALITSPTLRYLHLASLLMLHSCIALPCSPPVQVSFARRRQLLEGSDKAVQGTSRFAGLFTRGRQLAASSSLSMAYTVGYQ